MFTPRYQILYYAEQNSITLIQYYVDDNQKIKKIELDIIKDRNQLLTKIIILNKSFSCMSIM